MRKKNSQHTKLFSVTEHLLEEKKTRWHEEFLGFEWKKNTEKKLKKMI